MPSTALLLDYIEFHADPTNNGPYNVYNDVGDVIATSGGNSTFRKIETTNDHTTWAAIA
jgi:hypothetical protein